MKRAAQILIWSLFLINLLALVLALTDLWPDNALQGYRIHLVVILIVLGGVLRRLTKKYPSILK